MTEFLLLLLAHVLADFYWQPTSWVVAKREESFRSKYLYYHAGVVIATSYILLGYWTNPLPAFAIGFVHAIIDVIKKNLIKKVLQAGLSQIRLRMF